MKLFLLLISSISILSFGQTLDPSRSTNWTLSGLQEETIEPLIYLNFIDEGGSNDGVTNNDAIISSIISTYTGDSVVVYFPTGDYYFESTISLPNNFVLRGNSADSTGLIFNLGGVGNCIQTNGSQSTDTSNVTSGIMKDDTSCEIETSSTLSAGDWVLILDEDLPKITSTWAEHKTGQILQIDSRVGDVLSFKSPFRRAYELIDNPRLIKLTPQENVGIETLKITRLDATTGQTDNIQYRYTVNSWVSCIESYSSNFAHVRLEFANNCEVIGSYFKDGHDYGSGGKAYGVVCQFASGENLIHNNTFEHLRHSMLLQAGANGNVYSYNYSFDPFWTDVSLPSNSAGEITLHGNYVYLNLFEGNECDNIVIDNSHGINGPYNTFLRNRALGYGIVMNNSPASDRQNFMGNEISNTGFLLGNYILEGVDHFEYGNNKNGTIIPSGTDLPVINSAYITIEPSYYTAYSSWPPIGLPNSLNEFKIETRQNYGYGYLTTCSNTFYDIGIIENFEGKYMVFPNPSVGLVQINNLNWLEIDKIFISNYFGQSIPFELRGEVIDFTAQVDGVYFICILGKSGELNTIKLIKSTQ